MRVWECDIVSRCRSTRVWECGIMGVWECWSVGVGVWECGSVGVCSAGVW